MSDITRQPERPEYAWVEKPTKNGLRLVGFADEIAKRDYAHCGGIGHNGWYIDDFQDVVYRGVVYQLPGKHGKARYLAGYADPYNDAAFLGLGRVFEGLPDPDTARDAAYAADAIAERAAEREREFNEVANARFQYDTIPAELSQVRRDIIHIAAEARLARQFVQSETLCAVVRKSVRALLDQREKLIAKRQKLADGYSRSPYWEAAA